MNVDPMLVLVVRDITLIKQATVLFASAGKDVIFDIKNTFGSLTKFCYSRVRSLY